MSPPALAASADGATAAARTVREATEDREFDRRGAAAVHPSTVAVASESVIRPAGPRAVAEARTAIRRAGKLGAFVAVCEEDGDQPIRAGPLLGVPVAVKDDIDVAGHRVGNGTLGAAARVATTDAIVWRRLAGAGAVLVGRTRMHELAWGARTPGCRNPYDPRRGVGGSSGGSAAAVAAGIVPVALGTDTAGSIRIPAALCGVAGLRPTWGAVSLRGISPLAPRWTRSVRSPAPPLTVFLSIACWPIARRPTWART